MTNEEFTGEGLYPYRHKVNVAQEPWTVPIPGTTKLAHLEENLRGAENMFAMDDLRTFDDAMSTIEIAGDRYPPEQLKQIER